MNNEFLMRLFWDERPETAAECGLRLKASLERLALLSPEFQHWYQGIDGPGQTDDAHRLDTMQLTRFIKKGRDTIAPAKMADELGFSVRCWYSYGDGDNEIGTFKVKCASYNYGPYGPFNRVILNVFVAKPEMHSCLGLNKVLNIFRALIEIWEPSWANVWSDEIMDAVPEMPAGVPEMGWMLFLENERGPLPELGPAFEVVPIDSGNIIITGEEPPSAERNEGIKELYQLQSKLSAAQVMDPLHNC